MELVRLTWHPESTLLKSQWVRGGKGSKQWQELLQESHEAGHLTCLPVTYLYTHTPVSELKNDLPHARQNLPPEGSIQPPAPGEGLAPQKG